MAEMKPKDFIQKVLINEIGIIKEQHAYISFALMAIGIEFLGKALNNYDNWGEPHRGRKDFELAIKSLNSFVQYRPLLSSYDLCDSLRNGFAHSFVPKGKISLSSGNNETGHLIENSTNTKINLRCEDFYKDFANACSEVINMTTFPNNKMENPLLRVPDISNGLNTENSNSGSTMN